MTMKRCRSSALAGVAWLIASGCNGGNPAAVSAGICGPETTSVTVEVATEESVVFDWDPPCGVAFVLVEKGATDQWYIVTDEESWDDPNRANRIEPPVHYGVVPAEDLESREALPLSPGVTYEVVLWQVLPAGNSLPCLRRAGNACLIAVRPFER